jgi:hypothetical protein
MADADWRAVEAYLLLEEDARFRNILIHSREDLTFPVALQDAAALVPRATVKNQHGKVIDGSAYFGHLTALLAQPVLRPDPARERALAVVTFIRVLDFCNEHFYMLDPAQQTAFNADPHIRHLYEDLLATPALQTANDDKRRNQLRNFLVHDLHLGHTWKEVLNRAGMPFDQAWALVTGRDGARLTRQQQDEAWRARVA